MQQPLRYKISSWRQLPQAKSNNSKKLHIHVTDFTQSRRLQGLRISVKHEDLGTLFAYTLDAKGSIVTPYPNNDQQATPATILAELARFGFLIEYAPSKYLPSNQLIFLATINNLHFDKIRVLSVWDTPKGVKEFTTHIVAFQAAQHGDWLNSGYSPSIDEYTKGITQGSAIDISVISDAQNMDWSWLVGWVGSIPDILAENAEISL